MTVHSKLMLFVKAVMLSFALLSFAACSGGSEKLHPEVIKLQSLIQEARVAQPNIVSLELSPETLTMISDDLSRIDGYKGGIFVIGAAHAAPGYVENVDEYLSIINSSQMAAYEMLVEYEPDLLMIEGVALDRIRSRVDWENEIDSMFSEIFETVTGDTLDTEEVSEDGPREAPHFEAHFMYLKENPELHAAGFENRDLQKLSFVSHLGALSMQQEFVALDDQVNLVRSYIALGNTIRIAEQYGYEKPVIVIGAAHLEHYHMMKGDSFPGTYLLAY